MIFFLSQQTITNKYSKQRSVLVQRGTTFILHNRIELEPVSCRELKRKILGNEAGVELALLQLKVYKE